MKLSRPRPIYDPQDEAQVRVAIEQADAQNLKAGADLDNAGQRFVLPAPDGGKWLLGVSDSGALQTTRL